MLNCCRPRLRSSAVTGTGIVVTNWPFRLPVSVAGSRLISSTAIVPGGIGRAARPSAKNQLRLSGLYFGCCCISCRQAAVVKAMVIGNTQRSLFTIHIPNCDRMERFKELRRMKMVEFQIARLNTEKEAVGRCSFESLDTKERMV